MLGALYVSSEPESCRLPPAFTVQLSFGLGSPLDRQFEIGSLSCDAVMLFCEAAICGPTSGATLDDDPVTPARPLVKNNIAATKDTAGGAVCETVPLANLPHNLRLLLSRAGYPALEGYAA